MGRRWNCLVKFQGLTQFVCHRGVAFLLSRLGGILHDTRVPVVAHIGLVLAEDTGLGILDDVEFRAEDDAAVDVAWCIGLGVGRL